MTNAVLKTLDNQVKRGNFPMLDNGYIYLAGTKMSVFRSGEDWPLSSRS